MTLKTLDLTTDDTEGADPMAIEQRQLGNERTKVYVDGLDVVFERVFDAPRELVWKVYTEPERIARWWGTHGSRTEVVAMDLRVGGRWHYISHAPDREPIGFFGDYLEVEPPAMIKRTFAVDVPDFAPGNETMTLEDLGNGRTRITERGHFGSMAEIETQIQVGMVEGALGMYDRLAEEIALG
jgi:uncharacterized protein YndB with AHSA1/START domain